jgi:hypothetical protein
MKKAVTLFCMSHCIMLIFMVFFFSCASLIPLDKTTEKPITDVKSIAGTWSGAGSYCPPRNFPYVFFPTVFFTEDGTSILQISSAEDEYGPYRYKYSLHNGKICTNNGEYTLYERNGKRILVYRAAFLEARLEFISINNTLPKRRLFCNDCYYNSPANIY